MWKMWCEKCENQLSHAGIGVTWTVKYWIFKGQIMRKLYYSLTNKYLMHLGQIVFYTVL